jgi:PTS system mannose-specific IIA component
MKMIGLVLVTHAGIAQELVKSAEMIMGTIEGVEAVSINPNDQVDKIRESIEAAIRSVDKGSVIIMTDMFGGTPSNMSLSFLQDNHIEVVTGVNLPMMIKFLADRSKFGVAELAEKLKQCGRESIIVAGEYLKK